MYEIRFRPSYNVKGAVADTGWSRTRVYQFIKDGHIQTYKVGQRTFIDGQSLAQCFERVKKGEIH
jgi:hypothetical protein